jgi:gas vesicle protein
MHRPTKLTVVAMGLAILLAAARPSVAADGDPGGARANRVSQRELQLKIDQLGEQNRALESQNRAIQEQLNTQKQQIETLMHQMQATAQPVATLQQQVPQMQQQLSDVAKKQRSVPLEVGFRTGWSESPYGMPGGFYYAAFLNHRLLSHEDGIPGGFLAGEMLVGWTQGNHANTQANLVGFLGGPPVSSWSYTLSLQPTVQYHLEPALLGMESLAAFKPYVLAGPAMYINLLSTQLVATKHQPGAGYRHYDADPQGGGVFGLGFEQGLSALRVAPIQRLLDKSFVGAEWRYNQYGNGQGYSQYTGSLSFGW